MIATRGLAFRHPGGPRLAFADVSLQPGACLLLLGPSGSGKSTWLSLVAGLLPATDGELRVAGQDLRTLSGAQRDRWRGRTIGFLPQRLHLSEALSVERNLALAFFAAGQREDRGKIRDALAALGAQELAARKPSQLSVGQAQRVALARATLLAPQVLLADEPTASLDDAAAADAVALLRHCAAAHGATLVIATHDARVRAAMHEAEVMALAPAGAAA